MELNPPPATLVALFADRVKASGPRTALLEKRGDSFAPITWNELDRRVHHTAVVFVDNLGVAPGDRVVQIAENRSDWFVTDMAILLARAVHVPLHATLAAEQLAAQIVDSGAKVVVLSGARQVATLAAVANSLPDDVRFYSHDACNESQDRIGPAHVEHLGPLIESANANATDECGEPDPHDMATILYTSGTTGEPKGVMLSHRNLLGNAVATLDVFAMHEDDLRLSFLPWSHIFARTCGLYTWIASGATLAIAESREQIVANCQELRPTLLNGVPYFFDKLLRALTEAGVAEEPGSLLALFGGRMRICCTGGAALPRHVAEWFGRQNVPIIEGYGLTETSPVITVGRPDAIRIGTVGSAIDGAEVHIAPDGEILTRGDYIMLGYYNRPEATAEVIRDGWFHTGDLGSIDADGNLTITGRKKEILVTAAGKNVAPVQLESLLTQDATIDQALVLGDGRNYLTALLVPNRVALATKLSIKQEELELDDVRVQTFYEQCVAERLRSVSHYEQIRRFVLLPREFSIERGELTPTLKLRRHVIMENFADSVASLYDKLPA